MKTKTKKSNFVFKKWKKSFESKDYSDEVCSFLDQYYKTFLVQLTDF